MSTIEKQTQGLSTIVTLPLQDGEAAFRDATILVQRGDWLNGPCPYAGQHKHGDRHPSFGFNTRTGYGFCHVCGSMLLKELYALLAMSFTVEMKPRRMNR